jgi:hypothetical protein
VLISERAWDEPGIQLKPNSTFSTTLTYARFGCKPGSELGSGPENRPQL